MFNFPKTNKDLLVGMVAVFIAMWLVMYAIPELFVSLFHTPLGRLILLITVGLAGMKDVKVGAGLALVLVILWRTSMLGSIQGFII